MEILLVEDNLGDARAALESLKAGKVQCRVSLVRDGEEAMRFLRRETLFARVPRPDLILLDIGLPKLNGREVLAEIRGDYDLKDIPVVVLTGSLVHKAVLSAQNLEVDAYITKPVDLTQFIAAVKLVRKSLLAEVILPPMV
jgi:CheY-like chemotaxis protein